MGRSALFRSGTRWLQVSTGRCVVLIGKTKSIWWHYEDDNDQIPHPTSESNFLTELKLFGICSRCRCEFFPPNSQIRSGKRWCLKCRRNQYQSDIVQRGDKIFESRKASREKNKHKYRLRSIWKGMLARCYKVGALGYSNYGGRGISVCERWRFAFENFRDDMGEPPSKEYQLERKNNNGNYEPDNCTWATAKWQARNRRSSRFITAFGETKTIQEWSENFKIHRTTIANRIDKMKWNAERAISEPVMSSKEIARCSCLKRYGHG